MRKSLEECEILLVPPEDDLLMHDELVPRPRHEPALQVGARVDGFEGDGLDCSVHVEIDAIIIRVETRHHHAPVVRAAGVVLAGVVHGHLNQSESVKSSITAT